MAFPTIGAFQESTTTPAATSHPIVMPAAPGAGVFMVAFWTWGNASVTGWPDGWQAIVLGPGNDIIEIYAFEAGRDHLPIIHVGGGPGEPENFTLTTSVGRDSYAIAMAFDQDFPLSAIEFVNTGATGAGPRDCPNLVYAGSALDVLWLAFTSGAHPDISGFPTNYGLYQFNPQAIHFLHPGMAGRELNAASEDPGNFAPDCASDHQEITMGIALV